PWEAKNQPQRRNLRWPNDLRLAAPRGRCSAALLRINTFPKKPPLGSGRAVAPLPASGRGQPGRGRRAKPALRGRQLVAELVALGGKVAGVVGIGGSDDGDLVEDFEVEAVVDEGIHLLG